MFEDITKPLHLSGTIVRLGPLTEKDAPALFQIGQDERIWQYMARGPITSVEDALEFIPLQVRAELDAARQVPFAIYSVKTGQLIGSTRYLDIQPANYSLEIGYTFIHPDFWGTGAAEESQLLLTKHAIEVFGAGRVTLKTDGRNRRAQLALEHFGIVKEGVLRKHMTVRNGFVRDTVMYSVIREEWPEIWKRGAVLFGHEESSSETVSAR